jgi:hypothetical protein
LVDAVEGSPLPDGLEETQPLEEVVVGELITGERLA